MEAGRQSFPIHNTSSPRPLLDELVKGERFVLVDLLKLILGGFSQANFAL